MRKEDRAFYKNAGLLNPGAKDKLEKAGKPVGGDEFAVPRNEKERKIIEDAEKKGFHVTRDKNGDLNARKYNHPPGWNAERARSRHPMHKGARAA